MVELEHMDELQVMSSDSEDANSSSNGDHGDKFDQIHCERWAGVKVLPKGDKMVSPVCDVPF